jgi:NAD(P)-dependent dehydrogenase (short-subunit alcohol dehydrogenase family)
MPPLKDKIIVITGAGRGLGKCLADALAKRGAVVVASDLNSPEYAADVRDEAQVRALAAAVVEKCGRIDIWINNAGVWLPRMSVEQLDMQKVRGLFEVNVFGVMNGCRAALGVMKGTGTIVNIISTAALAGRPFTAAYSSSKHASKGFTDSLRLELVEEGKAINIIGVYPSGIKTDIFGDKRPDDFNTYMEPEFVSEAVVSNLEKTTPETELIIKRSE